MTSRRGAPSLASRVKRYIVSRELIAAGERVLVGVSGGPDSTCLLLLLAGLRQTLDFELHVGHFDHGLRGKRAAARERRFVEDLCESLAVPVHSGEGDVRAHAKAARLSIEEAARNLRYDFLCKVAKDAGCGAVATGHTKDDQAETVLMHIIRGSGLEGLSGIAPSSRWPVRVKASSPRLIRPLIEVSREETESFCLDRGVTPIDDPTNQSTAYTRNRIRQELLPSLRRLNPQVDDALAGLADSLASDLEALEVLSAALLKLGPGGVSIDRQAFLRAPRGVRARAVRQAFGSVAGTKRNLSQRHVIAVLETAGTTGSVLDLPGGVVVEVRRDRIRFELRPSTGKPSLSSRSVRLAVPGNTSFGPWRFEVEVVRAPRDTRRSPFTAYLNVESAGALSVRRRRPGDRLRPLGMNGSKKVQDLLVDSHVPRTERDAVPLVCSGDRIAWVVGHRIAEWAKVLEGAERAVRVRAVQIPRKTP
jgi:tRNA(Ile)-lysidine synthase